MASVSTDNAGRRRILFFDVNGKRRAIRLGKVPMKAAQEICRRVEYLVTAQISNSAVDADTARWVGSIGDDLTKKLAKVGLVAPRSSAALATFVDAYIDGRTDIKPRTRSNMEQTRRYMVDFFGPHRSLNSITMADADAWVIAMKATYAEATVARTLKRARQLYAAAKRARLVSESPFDHIKPGSMDNPDKLFFVSRDMTAKILNACPDAEWRVIIALCRYGGLRCPSELLALRWGDIDWDRDRLLVHSPKLEHCRNKGKRWVPLFPELREHLDYLYHSTPERTVHVIVKTRDAGVNWRTQFERIVQRAGLLIWDRPFQNMRATRETELAATFPLHVVTAWIGNSITTASRHYLSVTDADFTRAVIAGSGAQSGALRSGMEGTGGMGDHENARKALAFQQDSSHAAETIPLRGVEPLF